MAITALAQETITNHLTSTLDPSVYDAESIACDLVDLVIDAETAAWELALKDIKALIAEDLLSADAIAVVVSRYGLDT